MLHLFSQVVPLVAYMTLGAAQASPAHAPAMSNASIASAEAFPKLRIPFFGRKKKAAGDSAAVSKDAEKKAVKSNAGDDKKEKKEKEKKEKSKKEKEKKEKSPKPKAAKSKSPKTSREPMALVERRLRDLVMQQESWFVKEAHYSNNAYRAGLERKGDSTAFADVQVEVLYAGRRGWTAVGYHPKAPGKTCVIYVGFRERLPILPRTHESAREATLEGMPACDD